MSWTFDPQIADIRWVPQTTGGVGGVNTVERIVLTQEHIDNKGFFLEYTPLYPNAVTLVPDGGIPQVNGVDYEIVNGDFLSWKDLGLDNFLEVNEVLTIQYST
jgi:hypothetical protein